MTITPHFLPAEQVYRLEPKIFAGVQLSLIGDRSLFEAAGLVELSTIPEPQP
jgi:hypothetical protein